ncbi:hypothetical protein A0256_19730 [Mucilaginibacter sp. PAMC 26640]|nr:hypothetical protein A0256_19730 [Mucilaginibacter sp. PAMC 26640]
MKKILILEDDYDTGEIVEIALNGMYEILLKRDCLNLQEVLSAFLPDMILMDNFIQFGNAKGIVDGLRANGYKIDIPIVLFSAHSDVAELAAEIGAVDYLAKPFELEDLYSCLNRILTPEQPSQYKPYKNTLLLPKPPPS